MNHITFVVSVLEPWPDSLGGTPDYMKNSGENCTKATESNNMLDHFHREDIQRSQSYFVILLAVTILSIGSAAFFIAAKLQMCKISQASDHERQTEAISSSA